MPAFHHRPIRRTASPRRFGFSLIELMVGVVIGMVGLMAIFKTVATWDIHSRTTTAGGEADSTGTLAMFNIERDVKQAGMGIGRGDQAALGCNVVGNDNGGHGAISFLLAPVAITLGASGAPDSVDVLYGNSSFMVDVSSFSGSTATTKVMAAGDMKRYPGFKPGDLLVASDGANCQLLQVTDSSNVDGRTLTHATGSYPDYYSGAASTARFNDGTPATFASGGTLFDLGPAPQQNTWRIDAGRLVRADNIRGTSDAAIAEGVVDLRAQYGVDGLTGVADNKITPDEWTTAAPTDWTKVRAIRIAILVRSKQFERSADSEASGTPMPVTPDTPTWAGSTGAHANPFVMRNLAASAPANDWRFYRYRVYEKEIPLRNMIWGTAPPS